MATKIKLKSMFFGKAPPSEKVENIMPARCAKSGDDFSILLGWVDGKLTMLEGTLEREQKSDASGSSPCKLVLSNGIYSGKHYKCPICGNKGIVRCGKCCRITCRDQSGRFKCAYCGNSGTVSGDIKQIDAYETKHKSKSTK